MTILVTSGASRFAQTLAARLAPAHPIRLFDTHFTAPQPENVATITGDLRNRADVEPALVGVQTVIHLTPLVISQEVADETTALDFAMRGSYVLVNAARQTGVGKIILASTLDLFRRWPAHYQVNEQWRPRPEASVDHLCAWLAECSVRENIRFGELQVACLRFGAIVDDAQAASQPYDPRWLHIHDAVHGIERALAYQPERRPEWSIFHLTAPGPSAKIQLRHQASAQENFGYRPQHDFAHQAAGVTTDPARRDNRPWRTILAPEQPAPSRPIRNVAIFGAGGPMGVAVTQELLSSYQLRVTDLRALAEIAAENKPQAPGAPLPSSVAAPHEEVQVDVRDPQQVMAACAGMDAIINCTVVRPDPVNAFLVNAVGAFHVMRAAVAHGIRRVVHTGPTLLHPIWGVGDYSWDYDLHMDLPARPYDQIYIHTKYLGQEIVRVFAEQYGLEVPVLLFSALYNPDPSVIKEGYSLFTISWPDTGRALRRALEVVSLPAPYVVMSISADLPHGRFDHDKAHTILDWAPRDDLLHLWQEP
jgi:nucleoside-diphosphate-sugar epimerase